MSGKSFFFNSCISPSFLSDHHYCSISDSESINNSGISKIDFYKITIFFIFSILSGNLGEKIDLDRFREIDFSH